jgi:hypothetical protein
MSSEMIAALTQVLRSRNSNVHIFLGIYLLMLGAAPSIASPPECDPKPKPVSVKLASDVPDRVPLEGTIVLQVTVQKNGHASDPIVISSTNHLIDEFVLKSTEGWRFSRPKAICKVVFPMTIRDKPIERT